MQTLIIVACGFLILVLLILAFVAAERARDRALDAFFEGREPLTAERFGELHFPHCPQLAADLRIVMARNVGADLSRLHPSDSPWHPLLAGDDLGDVELLMTIEDGFAVRFPRSDDVRIRTFADLVECVRVLREEQGA